MTLKKIERDADEIAEVHDAMAKHYLSEGIICNPVTPPYPSINDMNKIVADPNLDLIYSYFNRTRTSVDIRYMVLIAKEEGRVKSMWGPLDGEASGVNLIVYMTEHYDKAWARMPASMLKAWFADTNPELMADPSFDSWWDSFNSYDWDDLGDDVINLTIWVDDDGNYQSSIERA